MRRRSAGGLAALAILAATPCGAQVADNSRVIDNWSEMRAALRRCWEVPPGTEGSFVTYRFSLGRTGALIGRKLVTGKHLAGDEAARARFLESGEALLRTCLPLPVTPGFGAQFGLNTITLTLVNGAAVAPRNLNNAITLSARD
ncbi:hypothetical protein [Methylobacterium oryzihabitans]|uniref:TonB C-terminal domain-containing protein n=1 Tax=Methylobacterium oryzihabitans TaxID=2499852 RepID=A0A437NW95_9HYPH|nr:hypothetical protein [Methylobacterium oryzihabitans]RVU14299.1 hypothetical protein EOE48_23650 [Methylobacterium oryzihabitans]